MLLKPDDQQAVVIYDRFLSLHSGVYLAQHKEVDRALEFIKYSGISKEQFNLIQTLFKLIQEE